MSRPSTLSELNSQIRTTNLPPLLVYPSLPALPSSAMLPALSNSSPAATSPRHFPLQPSVSLSSSSSSITSDSCSLTAPSSSFNISNPASEKSIDSSSRSTPSSSDSASIDGSQTATGPSVSAPAFPSVSGRLLPIPSPSYSSHSLPSGLLLSLGSARSSTSSPFSTRFHAVPFVPTPSRSMDSRLLAPLPSPLPGSASLPAFWTEQIPAASLTFSLSPSSITSPHPFFAGSTSSSRLFSSISSAVSSSFHSTISVSNLDAASLLSPSSSLLSSPSRRPLGSLGHSLAPIHAPAVTPSASNLASLNPLRSSSSSSIDAYFFAPSSACSTSSDSSASGSAASLSIHDLPPVLSLADLPSSIDLVALFSVPSNLTVPSASSSPSYSSSNDAEVGRRLSLPTDLDNASDDLAVHCGDNLDYQRDLSLSQADPHEMSSDSQWSSSSFSSSSTPTPTPLHSRTSSKAVFGDFPSASALSLSPLAPLPSLASSPSATPAGVSSVPSRTRSSLSAVRSVRTPPFLPLSTSSFSAEPHCNASPSLLSSGSSASVPPSLENSEPAPSSPPPLSPLHSPSVRKLAKLPASQHETHLSEGSFQRLVETKESIQQRETAESLTPLSPMSRPNTLKPPTVLLLSSSGSRPSTAPNVQTKPTQSFPPAVSALKESRFSPVLPSAVSSTASLTRTILSPSFPGSPSSSASSPLTSLADSHSLHVRSFSFASPSSSSSSVSASSAAAASRFSFRILGRNGSVAHPSTVPTRQSSSVTSGMLQNSRLAFWLQHQSASSSPFSSSFSSSSFSFFSSSSSFFSATAAISPALSSTVPSASSSSSYSSSSLSFSSSWSSVSSTSSFVASCSSSLSGSLY